MKRRTLWNIARFSLPVLLVLASVTGWQLAHAGKSAVLAAPAPTVSKAGFDTLAISASVTNSGNQSGFAKLQLLESNSTQTVRAETVNTTVGLGATVTLSINFTVPNVPGDFNMILKVEQTDATGAVVTVIATREFTLHVTLGGAIIVLIGDVIIT